MYSLLALMICKLMVTSGLHLESGARGCKIVDSEIRGGGGGEAPHMCLW